MPEQIASLSDTQNLLLATFRKLVKPMVRLFLAKGMTYTLLLEEIKRVFVEVAEEEFKINGKSQTDSRITLLTGVHRRDVHRLRSESVTETKSKANFSAQIIAQWIANARYIGSDGKPKPLPRSIRLGNEESFESLVATVSKDIRSRPVLDEWLRTGVVSLSEDGLVQLNTEAFIPNHDLEEQLFFLGMNVHDHLAAAVNNTLHDKKLFERCVYYDGLSIENIETLHAWVKEHGMNYLKSVNQLAMDETQADAPNRELQPTYRMNTGLYFYFSPTAKTVQDED